MAKQWGWNYGRNQSNNKYHNVKWELYGEKYDSQKECKRHQELKLLERAGEIKNLKRQVPFELIPNQYVDGKLVERKCMYVADFCYEENGKLVVEDVKSDITKTPLYKVKKKLMLKVHGIRIKEIQ